MNDFVIHRLRSKPVSYTVGINHFVAEGEWKMGIEVTGAGEDDENKRRIASDLRAAAEMLDPTVREAPATAGMESISEALEVAMDTIDHLYERLNGC